MSSGGAEKIVIVNADDLGRSPSVDEGIFAAHRDGIVTSATMMMGFATAETGRGLADHPDLGVGLHVTMTGARPTLPAAEVPSLVDSEGRLARHRDTLAAWSPKPAEVEAEIRHQLALFRDLAGREPTHLDGHHHCLRLPVVLDVLVKIAHEIGCPIRSASPQVAARLRAEGIPTTDAFVERFYDDEATEEVLLEILDSLAPGCTEIMVHPGRVDDFLRAGSTYLEPRERELEILTDPAWPTRLAERGVRLAHFGNVGRNHRDTLGG